MASKVNGHEVMAPSREAPEDGPLLACAVAFQRWSPAKVAAWLASPEFARVSVLCLSDPTVYGGETRLKSAIATAIADFSGGYDAAEELGRRPLGAGVREAATAPEAPPPASPGYGYRVCPKCGGAAEVRGLCCTCVVPVDGRPGHELFIIPLARGPSR